LQERKALYVLNNDHIESEELPLEHCWTKCKNFDSTCISFWSKETVLVLILLEELAKKEFCSKNFYFVCTGMPQGSSLDTIFFITETKTYKILLY
jgi:hypothetical protein